MDNPEDGAGGSPEGGPERGPERDDAVPKAGGIVDDRIVEMMVYLHEVLPD